MVGEWTGMGGSAAGCYGRTTSAEDQQLELTLGLPGCDRSWGGPVAREVVHQNKEEGSSSSTGLSLGLFASKCPKSSSTSSAGGRRGFVDAADETSPGGGYETMLQKADEDRNAGVGNGVDVVKPCSTPSAVSVPTSADGAVGQARSQARSTATAPVVGWPPIRSFRKNIAIATSSRLAQASKPAGAAGGSDLQQQQPQKPHPENPGCCSSSSSKGVFVKINMDGIPIGRKVDLKACDGYDSLSAKVDKLFRGLLMAAQKEPLAATSAPNSAAGEEAPVITGLLDGTGEYTLVYDDEEGDRILVGDVPWEMFVSTAKRLRVLKTSDLSKLSLGATSRKRAAPESSGVC